MHYMTVVIKTHFRQTLEPDIMACFVMSCLPFAVPTFHGEAEHKTPWIFHRFFKDKIDWMVWDISDSVVVKRAEKAKQRAAASKAPKTIALPTYDGCAAHL